MKKIFIELQKEWYLKLSQEGFQDIEDKKGYLKQYDRRTIAFDNYELIREFFFKLDHYLTEHPDMKPLDRQILLFYSDGKQVKEICKLVNRSYTLVRNIIRRYKIIITTPEMEHE